MASTALEPALACLRRTAEAANPPADRHLLDQFIKHGDQAAFAALVRRYGGRVLAACRQVLNDPADVDDAFQATFLVLLNKARALRGRGALGGWLAAVAHRVAVRARDSAHRRKRHEDRAAAAVCDVAPAPDLSWREACGLLHQELDRLPDRHRLPLVLCYLNGLSRDEAAIQLGWSTGSVKGRLERGRIVLRRRLERRGIELSAGLLAVLVGETRAVTIVPRELSRAAVQFAGGTSPSTAVTSLAGTAMRAAVGGPAYFASGLAIAISLFVAVAAVGLGSRSPAVSPPEKSQVNQDAPPPAAAAANEIRGRVLGPDGKPVAGAKLYLCGNAGKSAAPQPATDNDGRFRFALPANADHSPRYLLATADNLGLDWTDLRPSEASRDFTLRLPDDVPIRGRVLDLEGKPVAGAAIRIVSLTTSTSGTLDEFMKQWAKDKERTATGPAFRLLNEKQLWSPEALRSLATATTGSDGTFRLTGIGRERGLMLGVRGPGIADHYMRVVTRSDFVIQPASQGQVALSGPDLSVAVAPNKPILGTLRDAKTKQPLAGVRVLAYTPSRPIHWWWQPIETKTDAEGHYRLDGLTKADRQIVTFDPGAGAAHMHRFDVVGDSAGFAPTVHDSELFRGVVVSGQVTDKATGRAVRARVVYAPLMNNEHYSTTPGYDHPHTDLILWIESREMVTGEDGRYRLTALPGGGALFVQADDGARTFIQPSVPKNEQDPAVYDARGEVFLTLGMGDIFPMSHLHAYRLIHPAATARDETADFVLDPGARRQGKLIDPDGQPLSGADAFNLEPPSARVKTLSGAEFTADALSPTKPRRLLFWHRDRKLAGTVVLRGDEPEPVTVTLRPLAAITGRAALKNGEPLVGYSVEFGAWPELEWPGQRKQPEPEPILTDKDGRFRVQDLPAGVPLNIAIVNRKTRYSIIYREKVVLEPGVTKEFGDLRGPATEDSQ
jgi:RNA polymerase sigma factor (sigma-70 family)